MSDTYDTDLSALPPLTRAVVDGMSTGSERIGPVASDAGLRALLDALKSIESRLIAASL